MKKNILWSLVSGLMLLSLVMAACGPAPKTTPTTPPAVPSAPTAPVSPTSPTTPAPATPVPTTAAEKETVKPAEAPKYGGTLVLSGGEITLSDPIDSFAGEVSRDLTVEQLWAGDWAKGAAGGYGTAMSAWNGRLFVPDHNTGMLSVGERPQWQVDQNKNETTIVYQIRQGVRYALNPNSEASRLAAGREMTADDIVFNLKRAITDTKGRLYGGKPELRAAQMTKTGPWEVTIKVPVDATITALLYLGAAPTSGIVPPEVVSKYGDVRNYKNLVGTGPFILTDYIPGSAVVLVKNTNYWMKDPIGPGKGNQLPYIDVVRHLIIPDASTRQAALRTAKIDQMGGFGLEDAAQMRKTTPALREAPAGEAGGAGGRLHFNLKRAPFGDVRVRQAMVMAIDFKAINDSLYGGIGYLPSYPMSYQKEYAPLFLGLDDPEMPASVKELFSYNPEKARQLLKEAGYPNGFKTSVLLTSGSVDYYSIYKDMWAKVGIDLNLDVRDSGAIPSLRAARDYYMTNQCAGTPASAFYADTTFIPGSTFNCSQIDDSYINGMLEKMRVAALTDLTKAMGYYKEMTKYVLDQAFGLGGPAYPSTIFWWPWLRNYSGETSLGFSNAFWPKFIWLDGDLKKKIGY